MSGVNLAGKAPFPWAESMELGLGVLRLSSNAFWNLTPRELNAAASAHFRLGQASSMRAGLAALMRKYPDNKYPLQKDNSGE